MKKFLIFLNLLLHLLILSAVPCNVYISRPDETKYYINQKPTYSREWLEYDFHHMEAEATEETGPEDTYRVRKLSSITLADQQLNNIRYNTKTTLTFPEANWERALQIVTEEGNFFMGGGHGYEQYTDLKIYMDNVLINPKVGGVHSGQKLKIIETSVLNHPLDEETEIADITTTYVWNRDLVVIRSQYNWKETVEVNLAYAAMFPVLPTTTVSSKGQLFGQASQSLYVGYTPIYANSPGGVLYNRENDLRLQCRIIDPTKGLYGYRWNGNTKSYFKTASTYNKLYVSLISPPAEYNTSPGLRWDFTAEYRMWNQDLK
jgi:hypothetical protein